MRQTILRLQKNDRSAARSSPTEARVLAKRVARQAHKHSTTKSPKINNRAMPRTHHCSSLPKQPSCRDNCSLQRSIAVERAMFRPEHQARETTRAQKRQPTIPRCARSTARKSPDCTERPPREIATHAAQSNKDDGGPRRSQTRDATGRDTEQWHAATYR